jgi:hypothetical protein
MRSAVLWTQAKSRRSCISFSSTYTTSTAVELSRPLRFAYIALLICLVVTLPLSAQTSTANEHPQLTKCGADIANSGSILSTGEATSVEGQKTQAEEQKRQIEEEKQQIKQCEAAAASLSSGFELSAVQAPTAATQKDRAECEAKVLKPAKPEDGKAPDKIADAIEAPNNIADATKAALACEWTDPQGVDKVLAAFHFLTTGPRTVSLRCVIHVLEKGDPYPADECLFSAAMGSPDKYDQPVAQGLPNFLDVLAKANRLNQKAPDDEDKLFKSTDDIIKSIFDTGEGKRSLLQINDSFSRNNNYVALRQLLVAYSKVGHERPTYLTDLERLRAAFEMNAAKLAKQIAARITGAKS